MTGEWSKPDKRGISTLKQNVGSKVTLRGRRFRRAFERRHLSSEAWPAKQRALAIDWLRGKQSDLIRWKTLVGIAGQERLELANHLIEELLAGGWIQLEEKFSQGMWQPQAVLWLDLEELQHHFGLLNPVAVAEARRKALTGELSSLELENARKDLLKSRRSDRAVALMGLLRSLEEWKANSLEGTEREFSLYARGETKGISTSEWRWLKERIDLSVFGIEPHSPILWIKAPLKFIFEQSGNTAAFDLHDSPDFVGLPERRLRHLAKITGTVRLWHIFENRTNFETAVLQVPKDEGVIWTPGFPPIWWRKVVQKIVDETRANAEISCDPDPSGIFIAMQVGEIWTESGLQWSPAQMSGAHLKSLDRRRPLTEADRQFLRTLESATLPEALRDLALTLKEIGEKGEQEGLL